jgi:hypothetical protein
MRVLMLILMILVGLIPSLPSVAKVRRAAQCNWTKAKIDIDWTLTDYAANRCVRYKMTFGGGYNSFSAIGMCNDAMDHENFRLCHDRACHYLESEVSPPWTPCR